MLLSILSSILSQHLKETKGIQKIKNARLSTDRCLIGNCLHFQAPEQYKLSGEGSAREG